MSAWTIRISVSVVSLLISAPLQGNWDFGLGDRLVPAVRAALAGHQYISRELGVR